MTKFMKPATALLMMAGLSACGGGSATGGSQLATGQTFSQRAPIAERLEEAASQSSTPSESLPTSGTAIYQGGFDLGVPLAEDRTEDIIGLASVTVNFDDGDLSGRLDNMVGNNEGDITGSLDIVSGSVNRGTFTGRATGNIAVDGRDSAISLNLTDGLVTGSDANFITSGLSGDAPGLFNGDGRDISGSLYGRRR